MCKVCPSCKEAKDDSEFYADIRRVGGLSWSCRECKNAAKRATRLSRRDKEADELAHQVSKDKRIAYLASRPAYLKVYREINSSKVRELSRSWVIANKDRVKENIKAWRQDNPQAWAMNGKKRKLMVKVSTPAWAFDEFDTFVVAETYRLARLRSKVTGIKWQVDHSVPLKSKFVCGLYCADNLQVITAKENMLKGNRVWEDMWQ